MLTQQFCDRQRNDSQKMPRHVDDLLNLATERHEAVVAADVRGQLAWEETKKAWEEAEKAEVLRKTEAAAAQEHTKAAVLSAQAHKRMQQDKDAQAASAGAGAAGGLPPHLFPHP